MNKRAKMFFPVVLGKEVKKKIPTPSVLFEKGFKETEC